MIRHMETLYITGSFYDHILAKADQALSNTYLPSASHAVMGTIYF